MTEEQYIAHYARKHGGRKTFKELADSLEVSDSRIRYICKAHNIKVIGITESRVNFIRENHKKMDRTKLANAMGICYNALLAIVKKEGLNSLFPEVITRVGKNKNGANSGEVEEKKMYASTEERINRELIEAAKQVLRNPDECHSLQVLLAESIRRANPTKF